VAEVRRIAPLSLVLETGNVSALGAVVERAMKALGGVDRSQGLEGAYAPMGGTGPGPFGGNPPDDE